MFKSPKPFVFLGFFLIGLAVVLRFAALANPRVMLAVKPVSLLVLANISFVLALLKK
jgi:hypothetical protein